MSEKKDFWTSGKSLGTVVAVCTALAAGVSWVLNNWETTVSIQATQKSLQGEPISPKEAVLNLRRDMDYIKAREDSISSGWEPVERVEENIEPTDDDAPRVMRFQGREIEIRDRPQLTEKDLRDRFGMNLPEIQSCQGRGLALCEGLFSGAAMIRVFFSACSPRLS